MDSPAERMLRLFAGLEEAHGTHGEADRSSAKGGKLEIRGSARTLREPVTVALWQKHLDGRQPLGIIPIRRDGTCWWGAIDVDLYDLNHATMVERIERAGMPLVVCRTKSGGAHLYLFLSEPTPATEVRAKLQQLAAALGIGGSEVFPKQTELLIDRGDLGNWLNMPYFAGDKTERYSIKRTGMARTLSEFLRAAEEARTTIGSVQEPASTDESLDDGPPCLQHLTTIGFPEGTRNNGLFNLAIFAKKKYGDKWSEVLERYNQAYMSPPLPASEVLELIKNVERGDYNYKCKDQPICAHCNSSLCKTRRFGVGQVGEYPSIDGLSCTSTEPRLWYLNVDGRRLEFTTEQLHNYRLFNQLCMEKLLGPFLTLKQDTWNAMLQSAIKECTVTEAPMEVGAVGQFLEHLEDFLMDMHKGDKVEDLRLNMPWFNEDERRHYFRLRALMNYLERVGFREWRRNQVAERIRELGGGDHQFNIKGSLTRAFWVPELFRAAAPGALPRSRRDPL